MSAHPYTLLDVFTDVPLAGNGLAVVHDADGVSDDVMAAFARETKLSETTYVQTAGEPGADYRNRIWTVTEELPFAGHPSLGTAVAVALARGEDAASYVQQTHAGLQGIDVARDGDMWTAAVLQEPAVIEETQEPAAALAAVGLRAEDTDPELPCRAVSTGLRTVLLPVASRDAVARAVASYPAVHALLEGTFNLYVVHVDAAAGRAWARCFPSVFVEGEDPATGSAAGPLMASLHAQLGLERMTITQGVEMGRPSTLVAEVVGDRVRVSGGVVVLVTGTLTLP